MVATCCLAVLAHMALGVDAQEADAPAAEPPKTDWYMVVDRAGILDDGQEKSALDDAARLNRIGIPTQVITEFAGLSQQQADQRASELRVGHRIETAPGADDGLLVYAAVNAEQPGQVTIALSWGRKALPQNGLTEETARQTFDQLMTSQLAEGHPARAIVYGMRQFIYLHQYEPPPSTPLDGWQQSLHRVLQYAAPAVGVLGLISLFAAASSTSARRGWLLVGITGLMAAALAASSVPARSSIGILASLVLGGLVVWLAIQLDRPLAPPRVRTFRATPRIPGTGHERGAS